MKNARKIARATRRLRSLRLETLEARCVLTGSLPGVVSADSDLISANWFAASAQSSIAPASQQSEMEAGEFSPFVGPRAAVKSEWVAQLTPEGIRRVGI